MSVLSSRALHEQLSIIMGALTKAAVAEICEVVDEGYAVLQMEISRSHKENEDLRKKLHLIESIVVRGRAAAAAVATTREEEEEGPVTMEGAPQQPGRVEQQRDGDREEAAGGTPEEFPDVVLIKDEDSDSDDTFEESTKTPADGAAAKEGVSSPPISRRMKRRWTGNEDAEKSSSSEQKTSTKKTASVYSLDSPRSDPGRCVQLRDEAEATESVCSYTSQVDSDVQLVQECSLVPPSSNRPMYFSGGGALMESQSPSSRAELDLSVDPSWTAQTKAQMSYAQFHQSENVDGDAFGLKLVSVSGSTPTDCQVSESSSSAFDFEDGDMMNFALYREQSGRPGAGSRGKRFVCSVCNRTYATTQNLEVHMRIHTGERPFSCDQCGKKFTQSAHLKSHLSVHSGERPYACTFCSRSFIVKYSLKLHMKKCHPNVL